MEEEDIRELIEEKFSEISASEVSVGWLSGQFIPSSVSFGNVEDAIKGIISEIEDTIKRNIRDNSDRITTITENAERELDGLKEENQVLRARIAKLEKQVRAITDGRTE